jgi:hypothetical protein
MHLKDMLEELGNIDGHGDECKAQSLIRLNSFEANAIADRLRELTTLLKVAEKHVYATVGVNEIQSIFIGPYFSELKDLVDKLRE